MLKMQVVIQYVSIIVCVQT